VLWGLTQDSLARTRFPLGGFRKADIRNMAAESGFVDLANKSESYEICFVPDNDYRGFLKRRVPELEAQVDGGDFVLSDGTKVGKHRGYPFYTIGQRKGLEIAISSIPFVREFKDSPLSSNAFKYDE
jgi:tRNA-specific 2-thiouridylase